MIESLFALDVNLTHVIDTSGAYIPGHGTPTVILVGRNTNRGRASTIRTVMGIRGEPSAPADPRKKGLVWQAIVGQVDTPGSESQWVSAAETSRSALAKFPWSLAGGGAGGVLQSIETASAVNLGSNLFRIGFYGVMGADEAMTAPAATFVRLGVEGDYHRRLVVGDEQRDWATLDGDHAFHPYDSARKLVQLDVMPQHGKRLWPFRNDLGNRATFSRGTYFGDGRPWFEWHQIPRDEKANEWSISFFAFFVATHNHFVLDRGGKVFKQSAPVIKLPEDATEDDHLRLLGVLNSSTACFWLKQVSHNKGRPGAEQAGADEPWEHRFEFTGTKLQEYPLPTGYPLGLCREMDKLALRLAAVRPMEIAASGVPSRERLYAAESEWHSVRARMIALQEELDWRFYALYGLLDGELIAPDDAVPELNPGERAFEIVMARQIEAGELETTWFVHHNHKFTPITELPAHWTAEYRAIVEQRIAVIENNRNIALIERPECKRRWATEAGRRCRRRRCGTGSWTGAKRGNCGSTTSTGWSSRVR